MSLLDEKPVLPEQTVGKIVGATMREVGTKKSLCVEILFKSKEVQQKIKWKGWLSNKVNESTGKTYTQLVIEQLKTLSYKNNDVSLLAYPDARIDELFDVDREWELADVHYDTDSEGKETKYVVASWINDNSLGKTDEAFRSIRNRVSEMGLNAYLAGNNTGAATTTPQQQSFNAAAGEIPF